MYIKNIKAFTGTQYYLRIGDIEICVTTDVGPRIISLNLVGQENLMFQDLNELITKDVSQIYGTDSKWRLYGGHRVWLAPEEEQTYFPDCEKVDIEILTDTVLFTPKPRPNGLQLSLSISATKDRNSILVSYQVVNNSREQVKCALWGLTAFKSGGCMECKWSQRDTKYQPNRNVVFWPYSDVNDFRFKLNNDGFQLLSDINYRKPFKIGTFDPLLSVRYDLLNTIFTKSIVECDESYDVELPDLSCNFEAYTNDLIHEIEVLTAYKKLGFKDKITRSEIWTLKRNLEV
ncbi:MAG: DUF4380 domain-containing protein [Christensenellaceae bacterium]|jgi:hypothetical protein|nr:DUF4380 domain-containing protein [Christensenellaceae bacterium]